MNVIRQAGIIPQFHEQFKAPEVIASKGLPEFFNLIIALLNICGTLRNNKHCQWILHLSKDHFGHIFPKSILKLYRLYSIINGVI